MQLPEEVKITFVSAETKEPLSGLIAILSLVAPRKNNFPLGLFTSNAEGEILLIRTQVYKEIESLQNEFPMDYSTMPGKDTPCLIINIENTNDLESREKRMREFYPKEAKDLRAKLETACNIRCKSFLLEVMLTQKLSHLKVEVPAA